LAVTGCGTIGRIRAEFYEQAASARFILIGIYTGTRASAIATASPYPDQGRLFVDLEHGIFYRKQIGRRATRKRQTPAPVPQRLLAQMRCWAKLRLMAQCFVEFNGKPVASVKKDFRSAVGLAGLSGKVTPQPLNGIRRQPGSCS
jgi:hypothetical protein